MRDCFERGLLPLGERAASELLLRQCGAGIQLEPHLFGSLTRLGQHPQRLVESHRVALGGVELPPAVPRRQQVHEPQQHRDEHDHSPTQHLPTHGTHGKRPDAGAPASRRVSL